jgi:membrane protease YdiL (CAAX protease family)
MHGLADHLLMALIAVAYPVYATIEWNRRIRPALERGQPGALVRLYRETIIELWVLAAIIGVYWFWNGRPGAEIGLGVPGGWGFWIGGVIAIAAAVFLVLQMRMVRRSAEARAQVRRQLTGNMPLIIPRDERGRRIAIAASITAGICEEVLYRAYFIWYLVEWMPSLAALAISSAVFGLAHIYQGWGGAAKSTLAGVILGAAYLLTGSLWVGIVLHATIDITSLLTASLALESAEEGEEEPVGADDEESAEAGEDRATS